MGDVSVPIGKPNADKVFATILLRKKYMLYNCCATIHVFHNHASNFKRQWAQSDIQKVDVYTLLEPHGCTDFRVHKSVEDKYLDTRIKEYEKFANKKVQSVGDIDTLLWWNDRTHKWKAEAPAPTYFGASGRFYRMKNVSLYNDTFMRLADIYSLTVRDGFNIDIASGVNVVDRAFNCAFSYDYMTLTDTLIGLIPLVYMGVKHYPEFPPIMIPNKHLGRVGKYFKNFPGVIIKPLNANFYVKDFVTTDCGRMFHPHHEWIKNMRKYLVDRGSAKVKRSELGDAVGGTQVGDAVGGTQVGAVDVPKDSVAKKKVTSMVEGMTTPGEELRVMLSKYGGAEMKSATEVMDVCREIGERVKEIAEYAEVYSAEAQEIMESVKISEDDSRHRKTDGALDLGALAAEEENKDDDMVVYPSRDVVIRDATLFQSNEAWNKLRDMLRAKHPERDWMFVDPLTDENVIFDAIPALLNARTFTCYQDEYMAFMVFLPDNCRVIEIQYEEKADLRYWHVAQSIGMDYTVIPLKREPIQVQVEVALKRLDLYFGGRSVDMGEGHVGSVPMMLGGPVARNLEKPRVIIPDNLQLNLANKAFGEGMWAHNREEGFWGVLSQWHKRGYIDLAVSNTANPNIWMFGMGDILLYERDNLDYLGANLEYETGLFGGPYPVKENVRNKRWIYWAKYPELLDAMATDDAIQGWSGRTVGSIFYAAIKNSVQKAHRGGIAWDKYVDDCQLTTGGAYRVDKADYYRRVMTARFGVCVPGNGYKTSHEIEYMAFGTVPIMMKDVDVNYAVPLVEGVHYISVSAATEIPKVVRSMDEATWVRMSRACREWWKRCASVEGAFRTTMDCVRAAVAK
ncbi:unannotated protein [freshwater metagenome]|uniref:Unannotated protein n=1 Tax=freshwater metagenome TaxID=449393 RepID=A0A6J6F185_9ZZZZ